MDVNLSIFALDGGSESGRGREIVDFNRDELVSISTFHSLSEAEKTKRFIMRISVMPPGGTLQFRQNEVDQVQEQN